MVNRKSMLTAGGVVILGVVLAASVEALETVTRPMYLTFNAPFALPGVALPPGAYIFERAESTATISAVRVSSRDRSHVYLTAFTHVIARPTGLGGDRYVTFGEVRPGVTRPITAWYPNGELISHQFLYPEESRQLTQRDEN